MIDGDENLFAKSIERMINIQALRPDHKALIFAKSLDSDELNSPEEDQCISKKDIPADPEKIYGIFKRVIKPKREFNIKI